MHMPIKAKARAHGLMGVACIVAFAGCGPAKERDSRRVHPKHPEIV